MKKIENVEKKFIFFSTWFPIFFIGIFNANFWKPYCKKLKKFSKFSKIIFFYHEKNAGVEKMLTFSMQKKHIFRLVAFSERLEPPRSMVQKLTFPPILNTGYLQFQKSSVQQNTYCFEKGDGVLNFCPVCPIPNYQLIRSE